MGKEKKEIINKRRKGCYFCQEQTLPDFKDYQLLQRFLSSRARILPRAKTGVCAKHQRQLSTAIKQARHLGLLSFVVKAG